MELEPILEYLRTQGTQVESLDDIEEPSTVATISSLSLQVKRPFVKVTEYYPTASYEGAIFGRDPWIVDVDASISEESKLESMEVKMAAPAYRLKHKLCVPEIDFGHAFIFRLSPESELESEYYKTVQEWIDRPKQECAMS